MARAAILGMDVETMITGTPLDFAVRAKIAERANDLRLVMDDNLAVAIINRLAESLNRS